MERCKLTKRDILNVIAGALIAVVATGFYDCSFYFQKGEIENFNFAFVATLATLGLFAVYLIFFYFIFPPDAKNEILSVRQVEASNEASVDKEKEFQFEMSELERVHDEINLLVAVIGIAIGLFAAIITVVFALPDSSSALKNYLINVSLIPILVSIILVIALAYQYFIKLKNRKADIKKRFIYTKTEDKQLQKLDELLKESKMTNEFLKELNESKHKKDKTDSK